MKTALSLADWIDYARMEVNYRQRPTSQCCNGHISEAGRGAPHHRCNVREMQTGERLVYWELANQLPLANALVCVRFGHFGKCS